MCSEERYFKELLQMEFNKYKIDSSQYRDVQLCLFTFQIFLTPLAPLSPNDKYKNKIIVPFMQLIC